MACVDLPLLPKQVKTDVAGESEEEKAGQVLVLYFPPAPTPINWVWPWFSNDLNQTNVPIKFITNHLTNPIVNLPGCLAGLCHALNGWIPSFL